MRKCIEEMRQRFCARFCQSPNQAISTSEYTDLAPVDEIEEGAEYLNALNWAVGNKRVKNIALAGPYGSGKSSVIESFLKKNPKLKERSLRISMATFVEDKLDDEGKPKKVDIPDAEIEIGILKQLFYKVPRRKIPQSRYRKLQRVSWCKIWAYMLLLFALSSVLCYIFFTETFYLIRDDVIVAGESVRLTSKWSCIIFIVAVIGILAICAKLWRNVIYKFKIKEVRLPTNTVLHENSADKDSILNKNIDEIVYFFEETKYSVVFFEDLDRLSKPDVFVRLRELNTLLNNYDSIKRYIVFIYAVKDDIFSDNDRTKFFDFIIPVVPIINSTNSGEILLNKLAQAQDNGIGHKVSQEFVLDASPYISDMRILQNMFNEFLVFKKTLKSNQQLELTDEHMLALILFKNLYPREFADIQNERGIIKQAFEDKNQFFYTQCSTWEQEIVSVTKTIEEFPKATLKNTQELKISFLSSLVEFNGVTSHITSNGALAFRAEEILKDDFELSLLRPLDHVVCTYLSFDSNRHSPMTIRNYNEKIAMLLDRYEELKRIEIKGISGLQEEVESIRRQMSSFKSKSLRDILLQFDANDILSESVRKNKLLVFLLRRGYINEEYATHINYFKGNTITKDDMNFILSIKNREALPNNYRLTKTEMVIRRLQDYEFEQKEMYNFDLLDYLIANDEFRSKLIIFIEQLSDETDTSWEFINSFIDITANKSKFVSLLSAKWQGLWDKVYEDGILTYERKIFYFSLILTEVDIDTLCCMNQDTDSVERFFRDNNDVLMRLVDVPNDKIIDVVRSLKIEFAEIEVGGVHSDILDYIFENQHYKLNQNMVKRIVEHKDKSLLASLNNQNYTTIRRLNYKPLLAHVDNDTYVYIEEVVLNANNVKESQESIVLLLSKIIDDTDIALKLIDHQEFKFNSFADCCGDLIDTKETQVILLWDELLSKDKIALSWENVILYWEKKQFSDSLINYLDKHADTLKVISSASVPNEFIDMLILCNISDESFFKLLPWMPRIDLNLEIGSIAEIRVTYLIEIKYFDFTIERCKEILAAYPQLGIEFILAYEEDYMKLHGQIEIDTKLFEALLPKLMQNNMQKLFDEYGMSLLSEEIAEIALEQGLSIDKTMFDAMWEKLSVEDKETLMMNNLQLLGADDLEACFAQLGEKYSRFLYRSKRHDVKLSDTATNRKLAERLKDVSYITSCTRDTKNSRGGILLCRIKATH